MRFGRLTVLRVDHKQVVGKRYRYYWLCKCDCGKEHVARGDQLKSGNTQSCGCLHSETARKQAISLHYLHGLSHTLTYRKWQNVNKRCFDTRCKCYARYGGRGISVFPAWRNDFLAFYDYVSSLDHFGEAGYTLDRINNDGDYEPGNLRWANATTQARNRRSNIVVEYKGEKMTLLEASEKSGLSYGCLSGRYDRGDRGDWLFRPKQTFRKRPVTYKGQVMSITQLAKLTGIAAGTIQQRYSQGKRGADLYADLYKSSQHRGNHRDSERHDDTVERRD